jgi:hypothetical protein
MDSNNYHAPSGCCPYLQDSNCLCRSSFSKGQWKFEKCDYLHLDGDARRDAEKNCLEAKSHNIVTQKIRALAGLA